MPRLVINAPATLDDTSLVHDDYLVGEPLGPWQLRGSTFATTDIEDAREIVVGEQLSRQPQSQVTHVMAVPAVEALAILSRVHRLKVAD
jgi:hypothetical protein